MEATKTTVPAIVQDDPVEIRANWEKYPRLFKLAAYDAEKGIADIIRRAMALRGQTIDNNSVAFMARAVYDQIMTRRRYSCHGITLPELSKIVTDAVMEGRMEYVNAPSIYRAAIAWIQTEGQVLQEKAEKRRRRLAEEAARERMRAEYLKKAQSACVGSILRKSAEAKAITKPAKR